MKNLVKKNLNIFLVVTIFAVFYLFLFFNPLIRTANADDNNNSSNIQNDSSSSAPKCLNYTLTWQNDGTPVNPMNTADFETPPSLKISLPAKEDGNAPDISESGFEDDFVSASSSHKGKGVKWVCNDKSIAGSALEDTDSTFGLEECEAAAVIAQKYGAYVLLSEGISGVVDEFKQELINKYVNEGLKWLQNQANSLIKDVSLSKLFGLKRDYTIGNFIQNPRKIVDFVGELTGLSDITKNLGNQMKSKVQEQINNILQSAAEKFGGKLTEQAKEILKVGVTSAVPVNDSETQKEIARVGGKVDNVTAELQKQKKIEHIRQQCHLLLIQTVQQVKSSLLYQWTTQTVDWIEGGGITIENGKVHIEEPKFVKQPGKFLAQVGWEAVNRFLSHTIPQLCEPFRLQVTLNIPSTARQTNPYYDPNITCTINQVVQNVQDFYNSFRNGGWLGYREIMMPQNNYYDVSLNLMQRASEIQVSAQNEAQDMLNRTGGFPDTKVCTVWEKSSPLDNVDLGLCDTYRSKSLLTKWNVEREKCEAIEDYVYAITTTTATNTEAIGLGIPNDPDVFPNIENLKAKDFLGDYYVEVADGSKYLYHYTCLRTEITQPGILNQNLAKKATDIDIDNIINAQDLTNIDQILQNAIINKITKVGIRGLKGILSNLPMWTGNFVNSWQQKWVNYK